jgi:hypothetical protein
VVDVENENQNCFTWRRSSTLFVVNNGHILALSRLKSCDSTYMFADNPARGRMSPPTVRDMTPPPVLPALDHQPRGGASLGATVRSTAARPTPCLPASPHRVEGLRLAGVTTPPVTIPANVARNVAPTWAATRAGSVTSSPSIFNFMSLYDICVSSGHAALYKCDHIYH